MNLLETVRNVKTLEGAFPVYKGARISLEKVDPKAILPTAKYVIKGNLETIENIRKMFSKKGIDIFDLDRITNFGGITIAPPIVESDHLGVSIIDGEHRCYKALKAGKRITIILVEGAEPEPIGNPLNWEEVKEMDSAPEKGCDRRSLRNGIPDEPQELRKHYRDFSVFGSLGRRPTKNQNG